MEPNTEVKVRLQSFKSFRHYGGREIKTESSICKAVFLHEQNDHTILVSLLEDCAGYKAGHKIAISPLHFNIQTA